MKKLLWLFVFVFPFVFTTKSQNEGDFDKKFRFGLRVNPQPTWFFSNQKNNLPKGVRLGFGFGLNLEYKFSDVVSILTGIGGDFESGKYSFRNDYPNNYVVAYFKNESDELIEVKNGTADKFKKSGVKAYILKDRVVKTTFVTIPAILKLSTNENRGVKWFGLFGLELGVRVKAVATDSYYQIRNYTNDTVFADTPSPGSVSGINIGKDAALIPMRLGLNAGFGVDYNLGGTTSFLASINFFGSLFNDMRKESRYMISNWQEFDAAKGNTAVTYKMVNQNFLLRAVRINLGFMF